MKTANPHVDGEIEWVEQAPLGDLNSMGLRATARLLASVHTEEALVRFLQWAKREDEDFIILGGGTNVVFADDYLDRVILRLRGQFAQLSVNGESITSGAAVPLSRLVQEACRGGLAGLEGASGIPGALGGALRGNAGAYDWSLGDCVAWVEAFDRDGAKRRFAASEAGFGYRRSALADWLVTRAHLVLKPDDPDRILERIDATLARRSGQPYGVCSAGCVFKNPPGDRAARLIEAAGLKGERRGDAVVSPQHANFIVNEGAATGRDVMSLIDAVRRRVREIFGIELETEVQVFRSEK